MESRLAQLDRSTSYIMSRLSRSDVSYGPVGRVLWTLLVVIGVPYMTYWFLNIFAVMILVPYVLLLLPWLLQDIWKAVRVASPVIERHPPRT